MTLQLLVVALSARWWDRTRFAFDTVHRPLRKTTPVDRLLLLTRRLITWVPVVLSVACPFRLRANRCRTLVSNLPLLKLLVLMRTVTLKLRTSCVVIRKSPAPLLLLALVYVNQGLKGSLNTSVVARFIVLFVTVSLPLVRKHRRLVEGL